MLAVRDHVWRSRFRAFVWQYLRDVLWGGVWALINFILAVVSVALILDPHPPALPAGFTPARGLAAIVISATVHGYWRIWSRSMASAGRQLSDDELSITRIEQDVWDPLTDYLVGKILGFQCVAGPRSEIVDCRVRVEDLSIRSDDGSQWYRRTWFTPAELEWLNSDGVAHTFQAGAKRTAQLVLYQSVLQSATVRLATGERHVLDFPGTYRANISVEASGFAVRRLVCEFEWGQSGPLGWSEVHDPSLIKFQPSAPRTAEAPRR
jgi:hypothetical protein